MFDEVIEDRGRDAIRRLVGLLKLGAVGTVLNGILFVVKARADPLVAGFVFSFSLFCGAGAWITANGLDDRRRWARNAGIVFAVLTMLNVGIGTIFGLIELYSLFRAQRDGQFAEQVEAD